VQQAILYVGGIFTSLSTRYRKFEITYMMKHAGARFLFCVDEYVGTSFVEILEKVRVELPEMETIVACIIPTPGKNITAEEVIASCKRRLGNYKVPREILFMDKFPAPTIGKTQKFKLQEMRAQREKK
jgi:long-chain acyl-CoA synthetase